MSQEIHTKRFYANGKILLTGEYLVLFGARALAFPLVYGQELEVSANDNSIIVWKAYSPEGEWFSAEYSLPDFDIKQTGSIERALYLQKLLITFHGSKPEIFGKGLNFTTKTNFPVSWGLGTSSTLIFNLAAWAEVDVFKFYSQVSKGSGYDIACAGSSHPLVYQRTVSGKPLIEPIGFNKEFNSCLYLVFSGIKEPTEKHISEFLHRHHGFKNEIKTISHITDEVVHTNDFNKFSSLIRQHELIVGKILNTEPVQERSFSTFEGIIKSLGAWGGDFLLAASNKGDAYVKNYFKQFGLSVILPFNDTIIQ